MPGRRFWIIAASLSLSVAAMAAEPARKASAPLPGQPNIEADSYASEEGGKVVVATNAQLQSNDSFLSAKKIRLDYRTGVIVAEGEVVYATKSLRILGAKVTIDPRADIIEAISEVTAEAGVPHPDIITESGSAIVAYYSVLVINPPRMLPPERATKGIQTYLPISESVKP